MNNRYLVDLDTTEPYTDSNGVGWWSENYSAISPTPLQVFQSLVGQENCGIKILMVTEEGGTIQAIVGSEEDIEGFYLNTQLSGFLNEDKEITDIVLGSCELASDVITSWYANSRCAGFKLLEAGWQRGE
jgi:hypothetical protein